MRNILFCALLFCVQLLHASDYKSYLTSKVSKEDLKSLLKDSNDWVKYPSYSDRSKWNALTSDVNDVVIKRGEQRLNYEWKVIAASYYLEYWKSGDRKIMEDPYKDNISAVSNLFFAELVEGKGRFTSKLIDGVFCLCEMTSWSLSAHLANQTKSTKIPNHDEHVVELVSADVGSLLSWIYYFMKDEFDKYDVTISKRIKKEVNERIISAYLERDNYWWMGLRGKPNSLNNWNPWVNSNVIQSILLMSEDLDTKVEGVYKTMKSIDKYIELTNKDGACDEGPAYWQHAAGKLYDYLQILSDATQHKVNLFEDPLFSKMGEYISRTYVDGGWVINFADAMARMELDHHHIYRYGRAVASNELMTFAKHLGDQNSQIDNLYYDGDSKERDVFRFLEYLTYHKELNQVLGDHIPEKSTWYQKTEVCYFSNLNFRFATKGGNNNESHNHNDVGTFILYYHSIPYFIDAGVGTYTRQTFSSERYQLWNTQSKYHNLPIINGEQQCNGSKYVATNTVFNRSKNEFMLDMSSAYPERAEVKKWLRKYKLEKKRLLIEDDFELSQTKSPNEISFIVSGNVSLSKDGLIRIEKPEGILHLNYPKDTFEYNLETITLDDSRFSNIWGAKIYRIYLVEKHSHIKNRYTYSITIE